MSCPFMDANKFFEQIPDDCKDNFKSVFKTMMDRQNDQLKVDVKDEEKYDAPKEENVSGNTGSEPSQEEKRCPVMHTGSSQITQDDSNSDQNDANKNFMDDPQAFIERMAQKQAQGGGSCPFVGGQYFDPLNSKMKRGWNTQYKSKWSFLLDHKGRMSTKRFLRERKVFQKLPYCMQHSLYHPDDLKKLRDKPFSGLYFHFDKYKEEANKLYKEEKYFEAIDYYEQILSVFKWVEFTDEERNKDLAKALKFEPILDKDIKINEKDLQGDECEIELRTNLVVTLLMSIASAYMNLHFYDEAEKCLNHAIEVAPYAADAYLRRSQALMSNFESSMSDYKQAIGDLDIALKKRPNDKFYKQHKTDLDETIQNYIQRRVFFITEMVQKSQAQIVLKQKVAKRKQKLLEEEKRTEVNIEDTQKEEENSKLQYPDECKVMDIMKEKYQDAIAFFESSAEKEQVHLAVKENQIFRSIYYDNQVKYIEFDPSDIEDEIYQRLSEPIRQALAQREVLEEMRIILIRRASKILENDDMNKLNFQMFQYALNIFQEQKQKELKKLEEEAKKQEELLNPKKKGIGMKKLILINFIYLFLVGLGVMYATGRFNPFSLFQSMFGQAPKEGL